MASHEDSNQRIGPSGVTDSTTRVEARRAALGQDEDLTEEGLGVLLWRFDQLVAHGYSGRQASLIARDTSIDLELARRIVSELGCPRDLAAAILL